MKLDVEVNEITLSNVNSTGEFKIRNSAKAFKILSDGLYSNKIRAIIRELSCNAIDSHVAAGKQDVPFDVHLPSLLEPWFSVKDYGIGLSGDQVVNIYTTYFESTKTESNDFIGALGLGSKSPFSYTENFTVTAIKDGYKRIYSAFINELGVPSIAEMGEELTDEGNGVEVKFSVTDQGDFYSFRHEAQQVFMWFTNPVNVVGVSGFTVTKKYYKERDIVPGVHSTGDRVSYALMGNISYPISNISEANKHFGDIAHLLNCGLVIEFGIGELDFAASREELSYVPLTINSIKRKLEEVNANLSKYIAKRVDEIKHPWEKAEFLYENSRSSLYSSAVSKYVADTKFELYDGSAYSHQKVFKHPVRDLAKRDLSIVAFSTSPHTTTTIKPYNEYIGNEYVPSYSIPVDTSVVIVLNDLKTGCAARARYHFTQKYTKRQIVYCVSHSSTDLAERDKEYNKLVKELRNPPTVIKASDLIKRPSATRVAPTGISTLECRSGRDGEDSSDYKWIRYAGKLDDDEVYYYAPLVGNASAVDGVNTAVLAAHMHNCGIDNLGSIQIFGVRPNKMKAISSLDNWVPLGDLLKKKVDKLSTKYVTSMLTYGAVDEYYSTVYNTSTADLITDVNSDYVKFVSKYIVNRKTDGKVGSLAALCEVYGKKFDIDGIKKNIAEEKRLMIKKYPLLKFLAGAPFKDVAEYINLIDKSEKS